MILRDLSLAGLRYGLVRTVTAAMAIAVFASLPVDAQAGETLVADQSIRSVYLVKYRVANEVRYAKGPARKVIKVSAAQYRASNPYVCTPSGFGRKARCYTRSVFKRPGV